MAGPDDAEDERADLEGADEPHEESPSAKKKRLSGKKLVLFFVMPAVVTMLAGVVLYSGGAIDSLVSGDSGESGEDNEIEEPKDVVFYDLPEMLVNINSSGRRTHYLKISVSLELTNPKDVARLQQVLPRIIDNFQVYLRELRIEDLQGSAGLYRLREELLRRVTVAAAPAKVSDVLFKEMLIQ